MVDWPRSIWADKETACAIAARMRTTASRFSLFPLFMVSVQLDDVWRFRDGEVACSRSSHGTRLELRPPQLCDVVRVPTQWFSSRAAVSKSDCAAAL